MELRVTVVFWKMKKSEKMTKRLDDIYRNLHLISPRWRWDVENRQKWCMQQWAQLADAIDSFIWTFSVLTSAEGQPLP